MQRVYAQDDSEDDTVDGDDDAVVADSEDDADDEAEMEQTAGEQVDEDTGEADEDADVELGPSEDVDTSVVFPRHSNRKLPAGASIVILVTARNKGDDPIQFTGIEATLYQPSDYSQTFLNYSQTPFEDPIPAGNEATFLYQFKINPLYDPRDIGLVVKAFYQDSEEKLYMDASFNDTVSIVESQDQWDSRTLFIYGGVTIFAVLLGLVYIQRSNPALLGVTPTNTKTAVVETGTGSGTTTEQNGWLTGTNYNPEVAARSPSRKK